MKLLFRTPIFLLLSLSIILLTSSCSNDDDSPQQQFEIGQEHQGGIIFYLDESGTHGLIAMKTDMERLPYGCLMTREPMAQATGIGTGKENTIAIASLCDEENIAARFCLNLEGEGYNDWFLPSIDELEQMYIHRDLIGNFDTREGSIYSSSTEAEPINYTDGLLYSRSMVYYFGEEPIFEGRKAASQKDNTFPFRPIREF